MTRMTDYASSSPDHTPIANRQKSAAGVEHARTQWLRVWTIIFAGIVAALHIGKAPIAVPLLRQDLGLSLAFASWIIGAYAIIGAVAGLPAGILISFVGARRSLVIGLLVIGAASCAGALATSGPTLLVTRVLEGAGFLMVAIAAPMLLRMLTAAKDRDAVFGWWAIYFTAGSVIAMLAGPLVARFGWQSLWYTTGLLSLAYSVVAWFAAPSRAQGCAQRRRARCEISQESCGRPGPSCWRWRSASIPFNITRSAACCRACWSSDLRSPLRRQAGSAQPASWRAGSALSRRVFCYDKASRCGQSSRPLSVSWAWSRSAFSTPPCRFWALPRLGSPVSGRPVLSRRRFTRLLPGSRPELGDARAHGWMPGAGQPSGARPRPLRTRRSGRAFGMVRRARSVRRNCLRRRGGSVGDSQTVARAVKPSPRRISVRRRPA